AALCDGFAFDPLPFHQCRKEWFWTIVGSVFPEPPEQQRLNCRPSARRPLHACNPQIKILIVLEKYDYVGRFQVIFSRNGPLLPSFRSPRNATIAKVVPMTLPQMLTFAILAATMALFLWGRFRHDIVALMALMACVIVGLVPAADAFKGFGHPAVITVAC